MGQKMSGGLQACSTSNRPDRRARRVIHAVPRNEYTYSAMKPALLPPGAYGRYLYSRTPSMTWKPGSPAPFGQTTLTS
jgi:hypothetical protein